MDTHGQGVGACRLPPGTRAFALFEGGIIIIIIISLLYDIIYSIVSSIKLYHIIVCYIILCYERNRGWGVASLELPRKERTAS